jgi:isopentenyl diphosphate isomerase/L-lactate dehydrogenase-like FMN-dependent dehydrogenase
MQVSSMRHAALGLSKQAQPQQQVRFGETVYFSDGSPLGIKPITLKLDPDGKALAEKAIGAFEKVGMAMAASVGKVAESLRPYQSPMKDM